MKRFSLLLAALLCLCVASNAFAQTGATLLRENLTDTEWISGTNRLSVQGDPIDGYRAYAMTTLEGEALTEAIYANFSGKSGFVVATSLQAGDLMNADGLLDLDGNVLIPCEYGDIDVLSGEWAVGVKLLLATADNYDYTSWFSDNKYLIDSVDVYHLPEGTKLATLARSEYSDARAVNHCINIEDRTTGEVTTYDASFNALGTVKYTFSEDYAPADYETFYENRHYGIRDAQGNVVLEPTYATIYSAYQGAMRVSADDDKRGLITEQGDVIVAPEYDDVLSTYYLPDVAGQTSGYIAAGYVAVEVDGKLGYVDLSGALTCEPKYIAANMDVRGASATVADPLTGNLIMVAADGAENTVEGYSRVYPLSYGSGVFYQVNDDSYNYGMIDWHGDVIIPVQYKGVELSGDGQYALVEIDYHTAELYALTYPETAAAPAVATAQADTQSDAPAAQETAPTGDSAVLTLLESASALLTADASANANAAINLLNSAVTLLGSDSPAAGLLSSAITLLGSDASANAASVATLLESAAALL